MRIYTEFMSALDATGEGVSHRLSEVDVSNPEDVKAIIPDAEASGADVLVHFGEEKYLERYHQYQAHLVEWRTQYPKLASVDMRYQQQVVLEMQTGASTQSAELAAASASGDAAGTVQAKPVARKAAEPVHHAASKKAKSVRGKSARSPHTVAVSHPHATVAMPQGVAQ